MTIQQYVNEVLQVPVTIVGNKLIVEAMEIVCDTHQHKFYSLLAQATGKSPRQLDKPLRQARDRSLFNITTPLKQEIFGDKINVTVTEYIVKATQHYRRIYEDKES